MKPVSPTYSQPDVVIPGRPAFSTLVIPGRPAGANPESV